MGRGGDGQGAGGPWVLALCALSALFEGFDNQSLGVAAPALVPEFGLGHGQASLLLASAPVGLFMGAAAGGRFADRHGRKVALATSMALVGVCSLLTAAAPGFGLLLAARWLTGVGLGGALPNFIAMASEAIAPARRVSLVSLLMAGMPFGGVLAALTALQASAHGQGWRMIFLVGGFAPLAVAMLILWRLPGAEHRGTGASAGTAALRPVSQVLFGVGRARTTLLLWAGYFFTQLVLLLMLNWLPSLFVALGHTRNEASVAALCFNFFGAACSVVLGRLHAGGSRRAWAATTYVGMAFALAAIPAAGQRLGLAYAAVALAGVFTVGAQMVLFALAPLYYPGAERGTGVGWAVAVGRLGAVFGPLYAGALLGAGAASAAVLPGIVPFVAMGGVAAWALAARPREGDP